MLINLNIIYGHFIQELSDEIPQSEQSKCDTEEQVDIHPISDQSSCVWPLPMSTSRICLSPQTPKQCFLNCRSYSPGTVPDGFGPFKVIPSNPGSRPRHHVTFNISPQRGSAGIYMNK